MGFQTPLYELSDYLKWTTNGKIQLPDFQRGYKWEDERIRQLLVTILRGHPLGVVMLLKTGNDQIRFKPRPVEGADVPEGTPAESLLLDGQQRLTSLTQALTGSGVVNTMDSRVRPSNVATTSICTSRCLAKTALTKPSSPFPVTASSVLISVV